mmetsp:Transcript_59148/g.139281  ORF Transcript_59148/g.139281 Transcript_59148/m.139281 type:complete len:209 (+) Transcript_59148:7873-8499(+)
MSRSTYISRCAICPALPAAFSASSALTSSTVDWKRTRLPCRWMASMPSAVARCVLPVPGPPMSTTLCAASVNCAVCSLRTSVSSTALASKSKLARSRCAGKRAAVIWYAMERTLRSAPSASSSCSISCSGSSAAWRQCATSSGQLDAMPCSLSAFSRVTISVLMSVPPVGCAARRSAGRRRGALPSAPVWVGSVRGWRWHRPSGVPAR